MMLALLALVSIVAAENFYGDVAQQIGGTHVHVTSILNNPAQDPHLFEASPSVARAISAANVVVYNGADYDPWVPRLLSASRNGARTTIAVADLAGKHPGDNPHVWYDPTIVLAYARSLTGVLDRTDPADRTAFDDGLARFSASLAPLQARIAAMRSHVRGTPVLATEPVFGYLLDALGMRVLDDRFEIDVMNNTEPGAREVAEFESDLSQHRARLLIYNRQATDPVAERMRGLAQSAGIPIVGVTETEPPGMSYQQWIATELDAVARALGVSAH